MVQHVTVPLAGADVDQDAPGWKLSIGTHTETGSGKLRSDKYKDPDTGHFAFRILRANESDAKGHLPVDEGMQKALREATGQEYPRYVPIRVLSNELSDVRFAERASFWGGRRWCYCGKFWTKTREQAKAEDLPWLDEWPANPEAAVAQGLEWPPPDIVGNEVYLLGMATREDTWGPQQGSFAFEGGRPICNPSSCPLVVGDHGVPKHDGKSLCKPHIKVKCKLNFKLPPGESAYAYAATTGWNSLRVLGTSWRDTKNVEGCGWMPGVPLRLRVAKDRRTPRGQSKRQDIPILLFEPDGDIDEIVAAVAALSDKRAIIEARLVGDRAVLKQLTEGVVYERAVGREHHPDTADEEPAWIARAKTLMVGLQWSEGHQAATIQNVLDENQTPEALLADLEARVAQENEDEPIDVEAEAVEDPEEITSEMLTEYAIDHGIPESTMLHISSVAEQNGLAKGSPERRAVIMAEMVALVERQAATTDANGQGALL